ncbi:MAG: cytochrome c oxidase subunit II [Halobacteriota archaeon]
MSTTSATMADLVAVLAEGIPLAHQVDDEFRSQASIFEEIFWVFLVLGTIVGIVVISYMLYNGWRYRASAADGDPDDPPRLGELPHGQGGGKKLFLSFGISAVIVIVLVVWAYSALITVEAGQVDDVEEAMTVDVEGYTFAWDFQYENGETTTNELVVPEGEVIGLDVTSRDVWHTFGSTDLRIKTDAIPGQTSSTWFNADERGSYLVECFELCGAGHSDMEATIYVLSEDEFDEWYEDLGDENATAEIPSDLEDRT